MQPRVKDFKDHLKKAIKEGIKTSWEKNELVLFVEEVYSDFIERYLED